MTNRKIASELVVGIIIIIAVIVGGLVLLENKNVQTSSDSKQDAPVFVTNNKAEIKAAKVVVLLGDSITEHQNWNKLFDVSYITNAGISGNTTDDVISRLNAAVSSKPQKLFLMVGVNDLLRGRDVSYILANYEIILKGIRSESPGTTIYVQSVLPINNDISKIGTIDSQKIITLNDGLKSLADENEIFFIDLYPSFCGDDNKLYEKFAVDGVHLNSAGYAAWKNMISQHLMN